MWAAAWALTGWWTMPPASAWERRRASSWGRSPASWPAREYTESLGQKWYDGNTLSVAIGQENSAFTPIQLANYIATLVNGGTRYSTHLLKEVKSSDFTSVEYSYTPQVLSTIDIQPKNLEAVKAGMLALTSDGLGEPLFPGPGRKSGRQDRLGPDQRPEPVQRRVRLLCPL